MVAHSRFGLFLFVSFLSACVRLYVCICARCPSVSLCSYTYTCACTALPQATDSYSAMTAGERKEMLHPRIRTLL